MLQLYENALTKDALTQDAPTGDAAALAPEAEPSAAHPPGRPHGPCGLTLVRKK